MPSWRVVALLLIVSTSAHAQRGEAEAEFQRGRNLMAAGKYKQACEAFEASMKLDPGNGTLYNLALCHEKVGKLATAWSELVELSRSDSNQVRAKDSTKRAAALEPRLTRMHLVIAKPADGEKILRNNLDVTALADGEAPVDPGSYTFEATAPGRAPYSVDVELAEEGKTIEVRIPKLKKAATRDDDHPTPDAPTAGIVEEPATYPLDLPHRPILIPHGMGEFDANLSAGMSDNQDRTGFYAAAAARARLGPFEVQVVSGFIVRAPVFMDRPNPWDAFGVALRYPIAPELVIGLDYIERQPLREDIRGSDLAASVERKLLIFPRVAVDGLAGLEFSQREAPGNAFTVFGEGRVQFGVIGGLSVEASSRLDLRLAGDLYDHTAELDVGAFALYAISPDFDVFAGIRNSLLPDSALHTYLVGANWRIH